MRPNATQQRYVCITSGDGHVFVVPLEVANMSETIRSKSKTRKTNVGMLLSGFREQSSILFVPKVRTFRFTLTQTPNLNTTNVKHLAGGTGGVGRHPLASAILPEISREL